MKQRQPKVLLNAQGKSFYDSAGRNDRLEMGFGQSGPSSLLTVQSYDPLGTRWFAKDNLFSISEAWAKCYGYMGIAARNNASRVASRKLKLAVPDLEYEQKSLINKVFTKVSKCKSMDLGPNYVDVTDPDNGIIQILNCPNRLIRNSWELIYKIAFQLQMAGSSYLFKYRGGGEDIEQLILLDPRYVKIHVAKNEYKIEYYDYRDGSYIFRPEDIVHIKLPGEDEVYGTPWAFTAWNDSVYCFAKQKTDLARQRNFSRPDFLVLMKGAPTQEDIDSFKSGMEAQLRGSENTGNFIIADEDQMEIKPLDMFQGVEVGDPDQTVRKIFAAMHYPYSKFMSNEVNRASATVANNQWEEDLDDLCKAIDNGLEADLLPEYEELPEGATLYFESNRSEDPEFRLAKMERLYKAGIIDRKEAKQMDSELVSEDEDKGIFYQATANDKAKDNIKDTISEMETE